MARARGKLLQAVVILAVAFAIFQYGIRPPMPFSLLSLVHGDHAAGGAGLRLLRLRVLAGVRRAHLGDAGRAALAAAPARARRAAAAPGRVLRVLAGGGHREAPVELRAIHPAPPASISFRGKQIDLGRPTLRSARRASQDPANEGQARRGGRGDLRPELHVLPRRQPRRPRPLRPRLQPRAGRLHRSGDHRPALRGLPVLADRQGGPRAAQGVHALELGHAGVGGPSDRGADLAGDLLPLRDDRLPAARDEPLPARPGAGAPNLAGLLTGTAGAALAPRGREAQAAGQGRAASSSTTRSAPSAMGPKARATGRRPSACCRARGTSRRASTRSAARRPGQPPTDDDLVRVIETACRGPRCRPGEAMIGRRRTCRRWTAYVKAFAEASRAPRRSRSRSRPRSKLVRGVDQARQGDVRGDRVQQVPRAGGPGRPGAGLGPQGRLGEPGAGGEPPQGVDVPRRPRAQGRGACGSSPAWRARRCRRSSDSVREAGGGPSGASPTTSRPLGPRPAELGEPAPVPRGDRGGAVRPERRVLAGASGANFPWSAR